MNSQIAAILAEYPEIQFGIVFGSRARGTAHARSDLDLAIGTSAAIEILRLGELIGRLECVCRTSVDLVIIAEAPPGLRYRVFRDGEAVFLRDRDAFVRAKVRAILDYLDFKPIEDTLARGVLARASRGR